MNYARMLALLAVLLLLHGDPAAAQELQIGSNLVCDRKDQVERFVAHYSDDAQAAVEAVNTEVHDPTACVVATVAYVIGRRFATVRNKVGAFRIVEILVLGIATYEGILPLDPIKLYSLVAVEELSV